MTLKPPTDLDTFTGLDTRLDLIESSNLINVENSPYNAVDGGTGDQSAAIQAAITAAGVLGTGIYAPGHYRILTSLTIPLYFGFRIVGLDWETSIIEMATNNTPIFIFSRDNTHSVSIENIRIKYTTQQTNASHPNSYAIELRPNVTSVNGFYHWTLRNVKITNPTVGFGINNTNVGGFQVPCWGTKWDTVLFENPSQHAVKLASPVSIGQPCLEFDSVKVFCSGGLVPTGECFYIRGEVHVRGLDVENWYNKVWYADSTNGGCTFTGVHIEHHHATGDARIFELLNSNYTAQGVKISYDAITTFGPFRCFSGTPGYTIALDDIGVFLTASGSYPGGGSETNIIYFGGATGPTVLLGGYTLSNGPGAPQTLQAYRTADRLL